MFSKEKDIKLSKEFIQEIFTGFKDLSEINHYKRKEFISKLIGFSLELAKKDDNLLTTFLLQFKYQLLISDMKFQLDLFIECVKTDYETTLNILFTDNLIEHFKKEDIIKIGLSHMDKSGYSEYLDVLNFFDDNALTDIVNFYENNIKDFYISNWLKNELVHINETVEDLKQKVFNNINDSVDVKDVKEKVDWLTEKLGKFSLLTYRDTIQASLTETKELYQNLILENKKNNENNLLILDSLISEIKEISNETKQSFFPEEAKQYLSGYEKYLNYLIEEKNSILPILDEKDKAIVRLEIDRLKSSIDELALFKEDFKLEQLFKLKLGNKEIFLKKIQAIMQKIPLLQQDIKNPISIHQI
jgi:hypothetical protein